MKINKQGWHPVTRFPGNRISVNLGMKAWKLKVSQLCSVLMLSTFVNHAQTSNHHLHATPRWLATLQDTTTRPLGKTRGSILGKKRSGLSFTLQRQRHSRPWNVLQLPVNFTWDCLHQAFPQAVPTVCTQQRATFFLSLLRWFGLSQMPTGQSWRSLTMQEYMPEESKK